MILASTSASRRRVLEAAGVRFTALAPGVDEDAVKAAMLADGAGPAEIARELARRKALAIHAPAGVLVLGSDQTLDLDGVLYDKTFSLEETAERLRLLRGRTHVLHAALAVAHDGAVIWEDLQSPALTLRNFSDAFLDDYVARRGEAVASSVGAYHLEADGVQLMERIEGDHFAILGLPLLGLLSFLRAMGVVQS